MPDNQVKPMGSNGYGVGSDDDPIQREIVDNPPYVPPYGHADAPPPVPPEPDPDPDTQAYLDAFEAPVDPREAETMPTPEEYYDSFDKPDDPRDLPPDVPPDPPTDAPVNIGVPAVTQTGATLDCTTGNWDHEPTDYAYAWYTDDIPNGVTGSSCAVVLGDEGKGFSCLVTATNAIGSTAAPMSNVVVAA